MCVGDNDDDDVVDHHYHHHHHHNLFHDRAVAGLGTIITGLLRCVNFAPALPESLPRRFTFYNAANFNGFFNFY